MAMLSLLWILACISPDPQKSDDTVDTPVDTVVDTPVETVETVETTETTETVDTPVDTPEPPAPDCEIGTGQFEFQPLVDGQDIQSTRGAQGAQHIWGSVRCTGIEPGDSINPLDPNNPHVDFWIEHEGAQLGGYIDLPRPMRRDWGTGLLGDTLVFWVNEYWDTVGLDVVLRFHLRDVNGVEITKAVSLHTVADPSMGPPPSDTDLRAP